jgi:hypothetical protein
LAIYNAADDCRDGVGSAKSVIQGTLHGSTPVVLSLPAILDLLARAQH